MKRSLALIFLSVLSAQAQPPLIKKATVYMQENPLSALLGSLGAYVAVQFVKTQILASWACAPERWSSWTFARSETVDEKIKKDYAEPHALHEIAAYYAALKDIDEELSSLLSLKSTIGLLRNLILPEEFIDQRLLALIVLKQEIIDLTSAVRTRLRARAL